MAVSRERGAHAWEGRLTELEGYGIMALFTSKGSCQWFSSFGTGKWCIFHFAPEGDSYLEYTLQQWSLTLLGSWIPMRGDERHICRKKNITYKVRVLMTTHGSCLESHCFLIFFLSFFFLHTSPNLTVRGWSGAKVKIRILDVTELMSKWLFWVEECSELCELLIHED